MTSLVLIDLQCLVCPGARADPPGDGTRIYSGVKARGQVTRAGSSPAGFHSRTRVLSDGELDGQVGGGNQALILGSLAFSHRHGLRDG